MVPTGESRLVNALCALTYQHLIDVSPNQMEQQQAPTTIPSTITNGAAPLLVVSREQHRALTRRGDRFVLGAIRGQATAALTRCEKGPAGGAGGASVMRVNYLPIDASAKLAWPGR
jgi:hypothetical protein